MHNRDIGWKIVATDAARDISASGPPHPDLNAVMATVRAGRISTTKQCRRNDLATRKKQDTNSLAAPRLVARHDEGDSRAGPPRGPGSHGYADAAAKHSGPRTSPSTGDRLSTKDIVVIGPCTEVLPDHRRIPQHGVPSPLTGRRTTVDNSGGNR